MITKNTNNNIVLNSEQDNLIKELDDFLNNSESCFLVTGPSGCGKTTTISRYLLEQKEYEIEEIAILTPTHKAKQVIQKKTKNIFKCLTIHKFLGYNKDIDENGDVKFIIRQKKEDVEDLKLIIIDECSMLNEYNYTKLRKNIEQLNIKAIFMGDINQLPPINEDESPSFYIRNYFKLTKSIRNSGKIFQLCQSILKNLHKNKLPIGKFFKDNDELKIYRNSIDYIQDIVDNKNKDYKILCWTNAKCRKMNRLVRNRIYGYKCEDYMDNEKLIVLNQFQNDEEMIFTTNQELIVTKVNHKEIQTSNFDFIPKKYNIDVEGGIKIFELKTENTKIYKVKEESQNVIEQILSKIKADALYNKHHGNRLEAISLWELYYRVQELFIPPIEYNYAITVHRSQGSEWDIIYIEFADMMKNKNIKERNKLLYTAFSRTMNRLVVRYD